MVPAGVGARQGTAPNLPPGAGMDPDIAARLEDLQTLATFLVGTLFAVALYLALAPVGECSECDHCRKERLERKTYAFCPICLKSHKPGDPPHR